MSSRTARPCSSGFTLLQPSPAAGNARFQPAGSIRLTLRHHDSRPACRWVRRRIGCERVNRIAATSRNNGNLATAASVVFPTPPFAPVSAIRPSATGAIASISIIDNEGRSTGDYLRLPPGCQLNCRPAGPRNAASPTILNGFNGRRSRGRTPGYQVNVAAPVVHADTVPAPAIACGFLLRQQAVNDQILLRTSGAVAAGCVGTRYFFQRCGLCSGATQHHPRQFTRIRQCVYGGATRLRCFQPDRGPRQDAPCWLLSR